MDLFTSTQMDGLSPEEQAKKAIQHTLMQIRNHEFVGWYLGVGTQSFSLLTEALAAMTGKSVKLVRESFEPTSCRNPQGEDA